MRWIQSIPIWSEGNISCLLFFFFFLTQRKVLEVVEFLASQQGAACVQSALFSIVYTSSMEGKIMNTSTCFVRFDPFQYSFSLSSFFHPRGQEPLFIMHFEAGSHSGRKEIVLIFLPLIKVVLKWKVSELLRIQLGTWFEPGPFSVAGEITGSRSFSLYWFLSNSGPSKYSTKSVSPTVEPSATYSSLVLFGLVYAVLLEGELFHHLSPWCKYTRINHYPRACRDW